ncbi:PspC domain-containing protein [Tunturiibacter lichenicola]|uniref:PspC domain-containing protein n=1 Tax=Tunturiibacter lichenicola TaxID=2051959 RepID=UPI003D9B39CE
MFCTQCGNKVDLSSRFCTSCGAPVSASAAPPPPPPGYQPLAPRLTRSRDNRMIAGVCAGFAQHYGWDLNLVRVITALVSFFSGGTGVLVYLIAWVIIPEAPYALPAKSTANAS